MEIDTRQTVQRIHYTLLVFCLLLVSAGLVAVVWIAARAFAQADENTRRLLFYLAWTAAITLALTLLGLLWAVIRWIRMRMQGPARLPETPYIDAWSEAGKRIQAPGYEDDEEPQADDRWRE